MSGQDRYGPNAPATRVHVTDFDALAIGNMLAMLKPTKVRAALTLVRAARKQGGA